MGRFVTPTGLKRKTLQEIRIEIENALKQSFGPAFEASVDSPNGLFIGQVALAMSNLWELAQEVYISRDPAQASGVSLDWAAVLSRLTRKPAQACRVQAMLYTDGESATIPAGSSAMRSRGNLEFTLDDAVLIDRTSCQELLIVDDGSQKSTEYVFHFTFGDVTLNNSTSSSNLDVLRTLVLSAGGQAQLTGRGLQVRVSSGLVGITGTMPSNFKILSGTLGWFTAVSTGEQNCEVGELNTIPDAVSGWVGVYNYVTGVPGTNLEDDEALRMRRQAAAQSIQARGTDPALEAHLKQDVPGIIAARVVSNRTLTVDADGRPGKSFEALVVGGDDNDVARCILANQASGIQSYGNTSIEVVDSNGDGQIISFSRPVAKYLWVKVTYTLYGEEQPPTNDEIKTALISWAEREYQMGKDVIPDRIKGGLYEGTTGIGPATIQVAVTSTAGGTPSYGTSVIPISPAEYASLAAARITLVRT